jgi:hypothetical protein
MTQSANWIPFSGPQAFILAATLLLSAGLLAYLGTRLRHPFAPKIPGIGLSILLIAIWVLSLLTLAVSIATYIKILFQAYGPFTGATNPIAPVTTLSALVTFLVIAILTRRYGLRVALGSAIVGTIAAPMIFELPFDLIVMARVLPRPPAPTAQLTLLYFLPLFLWELASYSLLTLSPATMLSQKTLFALAGMFLVFGIWALEGFSYPSSPLPIALNAAGKILSFIVAISLFIPEKGAGLPSPPHNVDQLAA